MSDRATWQPSPLSEEEFKQKLKSDNPLEKFDAIKYEIATKTSDHFLIIRILTYLEFWFDRIIEKRIDDEVAVKTLQNFGFRRKMDLMKDWNLLIDENFRDIEIINSIRNIFAHHLYVDQAELESKIAQLNRYNDEQFSDLNPIDKMTAIVIDMMAILVSEV